MMTPRIPLNFFSIPFGITGLAGTWLTAAGQDRVGAGTGHVLLGLALAAWVVVAGLYLAHRPDVRADLRDPVVGPFASLAVITPMLLAGYAGLPVVVDVFLALTLLHGGWFTARLLRGEVPVDKVHPGHFLPTTAGGLVAAIAAADVGQHQLGLLMLGYGIMSWIVMGVVIMGRLMFRPPMPAALLPTFAILLAPPAVGSLAYFALFGDRVDAVAAVLGGYGILMVLVQAGLLPSFLHWHFAPSAWAFTFAWAAVATTVLHWLAGAPAAYTYLVLAAVTALVGGIAVRALVALVPGLTRWVSRAGATRAA